jgi:localization factor PodJL
VPKDYEQAASWFRKAAERGQVKAQHNLGVFYYKGLGVAKDEQQAYFWFLLASAAGDEEAVRARERVESGLTEAQRAATQAKARDWKPHPNK